jgi:hypothetical protein
LNGAHGRIIRGCALTPSGPPFGRSAPLRLRIFNYEEIIGSLVDELLTHAEILSDIEATSESPMQFTHLT